MRQRKDIGASVRQRILNFSKMEKRPYNEVLQYYAMDRFLFRMSNSVHAHRYILKGALLLRAWQSPESRPTMDIDLLGVTGNRSDDIIRHVKEIMAVEVISDGLVFEPTSIEAERITREAAYEGIRLRFYCFLGTTKIHMRMDLGFGDEIFPAAEKLELPGILELPATRLLCYSRESTIAEKFEAMVSLSYLNSRMKDFYDIWLLSRCFNFEGPVLAKALHLTFETRKTEMTPEIEAFSSKFVLGKRTQWAAFRKRVGERSIPNSFEEIVTQLEEFLLPVVRAFTLEKEPPDKWIAPGPWI